MAAAEPRPKETKANAAAALAVESSLPGVFGASVSVTSVKFTGQTKGELRIAGLAEAITDEQKAQLQAAANAAVGPDAEGVTIVRAKRKGKNVDVLFNAVAPGAPGAAPAGGGGGGGGAGGAPKGGGGGGKKAKAKKGGKGGGGAPGGRRKPAAVDTACGELIDFVTAAIAAGAAGPDAIRAALEPDFMSTLHALQNNAFASGMKAREGLPPLYIPNGTGTGGPP